MRLLFVVALVVCAQQADALERARRGLDSQDHPKSSLSDGTHDESWNLRLEARPGYDLVGGNPHHWQFSNPGRTTRMLIMRARWPETTRADIPIEGNLNQSMEDTRLFYLDSTWGKITYEYVYSPVVDLPTAAVSSDHSSIRDESLAENARLFGYHWCGGPCGTNLASSGYQDPALIGNESYFDMAVVAFRADPPNNLAWAGLGNVGSGFTWTKYGTSAGIMEHEIGHNYGINHGRPHKVRMGEPFNSPQWEGYSRMAAGGSVYANNEESRYNDNGHFGAANKHWLGWLEDSDVVFLHPNGSSTLDCSNCQTSWSGKLNTFDRPDVIPGMEPTPYFAAKIPVGTRNREVIYVYFRSSEEATRKGIGLQYCERNFGGDSGMTGTCYTWDAHGDSYTMDDSAILPGTTYVAFPPHDLVERVGWEEAMKVIPVITAVSVPDLDSDPNCVNLICNYDKEIAAEVSIRFLSDAEKATKTATSLPAGVTPQPTVLICNRHGVISSAAGNTRVVKPGSPISFSGSNKVVVVAEDKAKGAGGFGDFNVRFCPTSEDAAVYFYDDFPLAHTAFNAPIGYGATITHSIKPLDCCVPGTAMPSSGVRVVVVSQNDAKSFSIAEIEIYATSAPTTDIAPSSTCYMLPSTGSYYSGDSTTGVATKATDGDLSTHTHSGGPASGGGKDFLMCVLPSATPLASVKIAPRQSWSERSENFTLTVYGGIATDDTAEMAAVRPVGLLWSRLVEHSSSWYAGESYAVPTLPTSFPCDEHASGGPKTFHYAATQGKAYAVVSTTGSVAVSSDVSWTTCPGDTGSYDHDFSFQTRMPDGSLTCTPCPTRALDTAGIETCPSDVTCRLLSVPGVGGGLFQALGTVNGRRAYRGRAASGITWNGAASQWEMVGGDGSVTGVKQTNGFEEGWELQAGATTEYKGIIAVVVTQNVDNTMNVCEIEMYNAAGVNLAPMSTCWNLPGPSDGGDGHYYTGGENGEQDNLKDGDYSTCGGTGDGNRKGRKMLCMFSEPKMITRVYIRRRSNWGTRAVNMNLTLFDHIPNDYPPTMATFSGPFAAELGAEDMSGHGDYSICTLGFASTWATSAALSAPECEESRDFKGLAELERVDKMRTGGLGKLMEAGKYEVWACLFNNTCVASVASSDPPMEARMGLAGPDGVYGTADDRAWADWMCYVFDEAAQAFTPWGFNSQLRLFPPAALPANPAT